jgi:WD40 repeat protein
VTLIDARTLKPTGIVRIARVGVAGMAFAPGGHLLVAGDQNGFVSLVDADSQRVVRRWRAQVGGFYNPGVSADGRVLVTGSRGEHGSIRAWALPSGAPLGPRVHYGDNVGDIDLSPNGRTMAITDLPDVHPERAGIVLLDVPSMRRRAKLPNTMDVWDVVSFSPDGRYLVGGSWKGWWRMWSTRTWQPVTRPLTGHAGRVEYASMSPDGRTLATGGQESAIRLWDTRTQQPFGAPLPGLLNHGLTPQFSPDGAHLFALTEAGIGYRWDVRPAAWARFACAVAGRRLTRQEWQDALPGRPYAPAC